jgi:hypothetical protein
LLQWGVGDPVRAEREGARAREHERERDLPPHLDPIFAQAVAQFSCGRVDEAAKNLDEAMRLADAIGDPMELATARYCRVVAECHLRPGEARVHAEEAVRIAEASGNPILLTAAYAGSLLYATQVAKDIALARRAYELTRRWAEESDNRMTVNDAIAWMAGALIDDDSSEALTLLHRAINDCYGAGDWATQMEVLQIAVPALVRRGEHRLAVKVLGGVHHGGFNVPDFLGAVASVEDDLRHQLGDEFALLLEVGANILPGDLVREVLDAIDKSLRRLNAPKGDHPQTPEHHHSPAGHHQRSNSSKAR